MKMREFAERVVILLNCPNEIIGWKCWGQRVGKKKFISSYLDKGSKRTLKVAEG